MVPAPGEIQQGGTTMQTTTGNQTIHIFVTFGQAQPVKLEFQTDSATGLEIKRRAGASEVDGLYHRVDGQVVEIADDETVKLKNGLHFTVVPNGRVS